jgi:thioester reductase-like protein
MMLSERDAGPAYVIGDSRTGVCNSDDFIYRFIEGCIQLRATPFADYDVTARTRLDLMPVNHVVSDD